MTKKFTEIVEQIAAVTGETKAGANTAGRVGGAMYQPLAWAACATAWMDVSAMYPSDGADGGNTYSIDTALALLARDMSGVLNSRPGGVMVSFVNSGGRVETWRYRGNNFAAAGNWKRVMVSEGLNAGTDIAAFVTQLDSMVGDEWLGRYDLYGGSGNDLHTGQLWVMKDNTLSVAVTQVLIGSYARSGGSVSTQKKSTPTVLWRMCVPNLSNSDWYSLQSTFISSDGNAPLGQTNLTEDDFAPSMSYVKRKGGAGYTSVVRWSGETVMAVNLTEQGVTNVDASEVVWDTDRKTFLVRRNNLFYSEWDTRATWQSEGFRTVQGWAAGLYATARYEGLDGSVWLATSASELTQTQCGMEVVAWSGITTTQSARVSMASYGGSDPERVVWDTHYKNFFYCPTGNVSTGTLFVNWTNAERWRGKAWASGVTGNAQLRHNAIYRAGEGNSWVAQGSGTDETLVKL